MQAFLDRLRKRLNLPLFAECTTRELRRVDMLSTEVARNAGHVLCRQGDVGRECFVLIATLATASCPAVAAELETCALAVGAETPSVMDGTLSGADGTAGSGAGFATGAAGAGTLTNEEGTAGSGAVFATGSPREIGANPDVRAVYLGQVARG